MVGIPREIVEGVIRNCEVCAQQVPLRPHAQSVAIRTEELFETGQVYSGMQTLWDFLLLMTLMASCLMHTVTLHAAD